MKTYNIASIPATEQPRVVREAIKVLNAAQKFKFNLASRFDFGGENISARERFCPRMLPGLKS